MPRRKDKTWLVVDRDYIDESTAIIHAPSAEEAIAAMASTLGYLQGDPQTLQEFKEHAVAILLTKEQRKAIFGY